MIRRCRLFAALIVLLLATNALPQSMSVVTVAGSTTGGGYVDAVGTAARFSYPHGIVADSAGNVFVSDFGNHVIRKITPEGVVTSFAGLAGSTGGTDGTGSAARFNHPGGLAIDANDNIIVADTYNHTIRVITPAGVVSTIAGSAGKSGSSDGNGTAARFEFPEGVAVDQSGFIYVADTNNHTIRRIAGLNNTVTTYAGIAGQGGVDDGSPTSEIPARFEFPFDLAVDRDGNLYVADTNNHAIRKVTRERVVTTIAGNPTASPGSVDGMGLNARFRFPWGIDVAPNGDLWVADTRNDQIRKVTPAGAVTTMAGVPNGVGVRNGALSQARFTDPSALAFDRNGNLYIADRSNMVVRKVTPALDTTTFAGSAPIAGTNDGLVSSARFFLPAQLAFDRLGNIFLADRSRTIRKIDHDGNVTTFAGTANQSGSQDGTGAAARFAYPTGVAVDANNTIWVADTLNHTIRKITQDGTVTTVAGAAGVPGKADGLGAQARFNEPEALAFDDRGFLFIADSNNHLIRVLDLNGVVTTYAGTGVAGSSNGGSFEASFRFPTGVAVDANRNLFVADWGNSLIRKITPNGTVSTLAGRAEIDSWGDGPPPLTYFDHPRGLTVATNGDIYVADEENHALRRVTPTGTVSTVVGKSGTPGNVDGTGSSARLYLPMSVTSDSTGAIWISDSYNHALKVARFAVPRITSLKATPDLLAAAGSSTLSWTTTDATTVTITPSVGPDVGAVATSGTRVVNVTQTTRYTLTATGPGGTTTAVVTVYIGAPARRRPVR